MIRPSPISRLAMRPQTIGPIMASLAGHPAGLTSNMLADETGWTVSVASLRLGRLAIAGTVDRHRARSRNGQRFIYSLPEVAHA